MMKVEAETNQVEAEQKPPVEHKPRNGGGRGGGRSFGSGHGGGRSGIENYGPNNDRQSIMERKKKSNCNHCGQLGHWWLECSIRLAEEAATERAAAAARSGNAGAIHPATTSSSTAGNQNGQ
jgi:hypothetical protein